MSGSATPTGMVPVALRLLPNAMVTGTADARSSVKGSTTVPAERRTTTVSDGTRIPMGDSSTQTEALVRAVTPHVPYVLTVLPDTTPDEELQVHNLLLLGTLASNRRLARFSAEGVFAPETRAQGYSIHVAPSPLNPDRTLAVICGADPEGSIHGVRDFFHRYADPMRYGPVAVYNKPTEVFQSSVPLPPFDLRDAPAFPLRGFWTWGHVVWDYRRYIDHMTLWKLNVLTLWNDFVPVNAKEVIEYAHRRGVKVVWGFSWCWGFKVDPTHTEDMERWRRKVLETYERHYPHLGGDGIYFQTFTEHIGEEVGGRSTASCTTP